MAKSRSKSARLTQISKYLSKHLRHDPDRLGLSLAPGGWVPVAQLLAAAAADNFPISAAELAIVVADSDKQRFAFSADGQSIRANQGHSSPVDLQLQPQTPPLYLYHGTAQASLAAILSQGLQKMSRHQVHLSTDPETARKVGQRHGKPVVLVVEAEKLAKTGVCFWRSANGVWLVDQVPPEYLRLESEGTDGQNPENFSGCG